MRSLCTQINTWSVHEMFQRKAKEVKLLLTLNLDCWLLLIKYDTLNVVECCESAVMKLTLCFVAILCARQVYCHDFSSKDRYDGPQCSAATPGDHSGLPEGSWCFCQTVPLSIFQAQMFCKCDTHAYPCVPSYVSCGLSECPLCAFSEINLMCPWRALPRVNYRTV